MTDKFTSKDRELVINELEKIQKTKLHKVQSFQKLYQLVYTIKIFLC